MDGLQKGMKQVAGNGRKKSEGNNSSNYSGIVPTQFCSTSYGGAGNETVSFPARSFSSSLLNPMPISTFPLQLGHSQRIPPNSSLPINRPLGNSSSDLAWTTLALLRAATTAQQQPSTSSSATVSFANMSVQQLQGMYEQKIASLVTGALCRGGAPRADTTALVALARSLSSHTSSQILSHNHHQQQPTLNLLEGHEQWRQVMGFQNQHQNQHVQDVASTGKALNDSTKCISSLAQHDPKAVQMAAVASHTTNQRKTKRTSKSSNSGTKFTRHKKKKVQQGEDHLTRTVMTSASTPATCAPRNEYCAPRNEYCSNKLSSSENPATEPKNIKEPEMKQGFRIGTVFALPTPAHMATESNAMTTINTDTSNIESKSSFLLPCRARSMPPDHNFRLAHFVIHNNIQHGDELVCSYEACRHAGIKFQYCARCRIPVAKRNFNQRHSHGLPRGVTTVQSTCSKVKNTSIPAAAATSTFGDNFQSSVPVVEHSSTSRRGIHANIQTDKDDDSTSSSTSCSNNVDNHIANDLEKDEKKRQTGSSKDGNEDDELETESSSSLQTEASPSRNAISTPEDSDFSSETQKKAKRRLETRRGPKMEISTVSVHPDKQQQLRKNVTRDRVDSTEVHPPLLVEPNAEISMERQWRWASLLSKRPDIDDSDRMSTWLAEVMAVSDCQHPLRHPGISSPAYSSSDFTSSDDDGNHDDDCLSIACSSSTSEAATSSMASCTRDAREQQRADRKRETTMNKT